MDLTNELTRQHSQIPSANNGYTAHHPIASWFIHNVNSNTGVVEWMGDTDSAALHDHASTFRLPARLSSDSIDGGFGNILDSLAE